MKTALEGKMNSIKKRLSKLEKDVDPDALAEAVERARQEALRGARLVLVHSLYGELVAVLMRKQGQCFRPLFALSHRCWRGAAAPRRGRERRRVGYRP